MTDVRGSWAERYGDSVLDVFLLPLTCWSHVFAFQQRLVYEMSGEPRRRGALILCEHPEIITIGRQGSHRHLSEDVSLGRVPLQWTNRGGGCWLHLPGQLAVYPIIPIHETDGLDRYRSSLYEVFVRAMEDHKVVASRDWENGGIVSGDREIASVGFAVKNWVAYHGGRINVNVPLDRFDSIQGNPNLPRRMTSMFRELRVPIRMDSVRESIVRHFVRQFGFSEYYLCDPPALAITRKATNVAS